MRNRFVCALWLSTHMKSVVEQGFLTNSHSTTKWLKHSLNFESIENVRSSNVVKFELRHISSVKWFDVWVTFAEPAFKPNKPHSVSCDRFYTSLQYLSTAETGHWQLRNKSLWQGDIPMHNTTSATSDESITTKVKVQDALTKAMPRFAVSVSCSQVRNKICTVVATIVSNYCWQLHTDNTTTVTADFTASYDIYKVCTPSWKLNSHTFKDDQLTLHCTVRNTCTTIA